MSLLGTRSRRAALVVITVAFGLLVQSVGASAATAPVLGVHYLAPAVVCSHSDTGGVASVYTQQGRIDPSGWEYLQHASMMQNKITGQWVPTSWSPLGTQFEPGDPVIPFNEPDVIPLAPGHYYGGTWYRWWYWTGTQWSPVTRWARAGAYYSQTDVNSVPDIDCDTKGFSNQVGHTVSSTSVGSTLRHFIRLQHTARDVRASDRATQVVARQSPLCFGREPTIVGTDGPDVLRGTAASDVIVGMGGDDLILGGGGADYLCGGEGTDGILGGKGSDRLAGGAGDDALLGGSGRDLLIGGDGLDIAEGGPGGDRLLGGGQSLDVLSYLFSPRGVQVDFRTGRALGDGLDVFRGFNAVVGSNQDDVLRGTAGEQWFVPLGGDDRVTGGTGPDVILYLLSENGVSVNLADGREVGEGRDELAELEVVFGSSHDDAIVGDAGYNWLFGDEGNDALDGIAGDDTLDADGGTDVCVNGLTYVDCENQGDGLIAPDAPVPQSGEEPNDPPS